MLLAFIAGVLLGVLFFGGLYLTVRQLTTMKHPALFMMLSLILRLVVVAGGIYLIMDGEVRNMLSAMAGILLVRFVLIRKLGKPGLSDGKKGA